MNCIFFLGLFILIIYLYKNKKHNGGKVQGPPVDKPRGTGSENMPDGTEKEAQLKKEQKMKKNITRKQNVKIKSTYKQNAIQRRLDQLITENGREFLTFLWLQRNITKSLRTSMDFYFCVDTLGPDKKFSYKNSAKYLESN